MCSGTAMESSTVESSSLYRWSDEDTRRLISWRVANASLFTGKRNAAISGYEAFITAGGLEGKVTAVFIKKKWENLKQIYKHNYTVADQQSREETLKMKLKFPSTGVSTEGGETTAASWKWYTLMDEAIGGWPSITPPVLIASSSQDVVVAEPPSVVTPQRVASMTSTPKRRRVDVMDALAEIKKMEESMMEREEARAREEAEREERRYQEAVEREERRHREATEREERRYREAAEREERRHRESVEREERMMREMRERDERRDRETAAREERFLDVLMLLKK